MGDKVQVTQTFPTLAFSEEPPVNFRWGFACPVTLPSSPRDLVGDSWLMSAPLSHP
jgi:hypothetical protein